MGTNTKVGRTPQTVVMDEGHLLEVEGLRVTFSTREGELTAVHDVGYWVGHGETLGIVGESGCGKSVSTRAILRLVPSNGRIDSGSIRFRSAAGPVELTAIDSEGDTIRGIRGREIAIVFQEPMTSFSPVLTVGRQIAEVVELHQQCDKDEARDRAIEALRSVGMPRPERHIDSYPFKLSGGMRQRAMIAMAIACSPSLLIADEPTSALDVTIQSQILDLLRARQRESGMAVMMITHDLGVIAETADRVLVMYLGESVEYASVDDLFHEPLHPYTVGLLGSIPRIAGDERVPLSPIRGTVPSLLERPTACPFHTRCDRVIAGVCDRVRPPLVEVSDGHSVRCHLFGDTSRRSEEACDA